MPTVTEIIRDIQEELPDGSVSVTRLLALINEGAREIALGQFPHFNVPEICLPSLHATGEVTTTGVASSASLASLDRPFCKKLVSASINGSPLIPKATPTQIERWFPGLEATGQPHMVCVAGGSLVYAPKGEATVTISYFAYPDDMGLTSTPDFLPSELQMKLLKNYCLSNLPTKYIRDIAYNPYEMYGQAIGQLFQVHGPYAPKPAFMINETMMYLESAAT